MPVLPTPEEFAALVAAFPDIPDWCWHLTVSAGKAGEMIGIQPGSIRIPRDAPGGQWLLGTLVQWRASLPGRGSGPGRPPADIPALVAELRERVTGEDGPLTVTRVSELLGRGRPLARRVYAEFTGHEPVRGRLPGR
jgi:hypothetical protein